MCEVGNMKRLVLLTILAFCFGAQAEVTKKAGPSGIPEQIRDKAAEAFSNVPGVTRDQKFLLKQVYMKTYDAGKTIGLEIVKQKALLFRTIAKKDYKAKEVEDIKHRVVELDGERLKIMFNALEVVQGVVGFGEGHQDMYQHFYDYEEPKYDDLALKNK
jgi:hypothetical protein